MGSYLKLESQTRRASVSAEIRKTAHYWAPHHAYKMCLTAKQDRRAFGFNATPVPENREHTMRAEQDKMKGTNLQNIYSKARLIPLLDYCTRIYHLILILARLNRIATANSAPLPLEWLAQRI